MQSPDLAAAKPKIVKLSRTLHGLRERVFAAWGSAEHVSRWFAPLPYTVPEAKIEMRPGGAFDICMQAPDGGRHWTRGSFVEVVAPQRLVIDMAPTDNDGRTLFRAHTVIEFFDALGGTRIEVTQSYELLDPAVAGPMVAGAEMGWTATLEQFERVLVGLTQPASAPRSAVHATFHLERTYAASAARVWAALTDPEAKARWFSGPPGGWTLTERSMDVRPGGRERLAGRWDNGVVSAFDATYFDVIENERLVYSYEMHMDEKKISVSLATMQIRPAIDGRTTLLVTEQGVFLDGYDDAGSREHGTSHLLDTLGASLASEG